MYFTSISFPPTFTMMHLCITQCTYWRPLINSAGEYVVPGTRHVLWRCRFTFDDDLILNYVCIFMTTSSSSNFSLLSRLFCLINGKLALMLSALNVLLLF